MRITLDQLRAAGACKGQVDLFESLNGHKIEITESLVLEHADKFLLNWAAQNLLSPEGFAEYQRAMAPAFAAHERAIKDAAWAEYERARWAAESDYERALYAAKSDYERALDAAFIAVATLEKESNQ